MRWCPISASPQWFDRHARAFDRVYARPRAAKALGRGGPAAGLRLAVETVRSRPGASVLDVGCGPGRVGEAVLRAGASAYVGVDSSGTMLSLARARLAPFEHVQLIEANLLDLALPAEFDVVLALGLFDYIADAPRAARWLREYCRTCLVASFTRRDAVKAPLRRLRYRMAGGRVFDFEEADVRQLLVGAGFAAVHVHSRNRRGLRVTAEP